MKKLYWLICFLAPAWAIAQDYVPLLSYDNTWKVEITGWGVSHQTFFFEGDTVVENLTYHKLYYTTEGLEGTYFYAMMREDLAEQKVFVRYIDTPEELFYDFNLQVGEDITIYPTGYPVTGTVSAIGTEMVNGTLRKRIDFTVDWFTDSWIVGVGSTLGLTNPFSKFPDFEPALTCFYEGNDLAWDNPTDMVTCDIQLEVDNAVQGTEVTIGPNPARTAFQVSFGAAYGGKKVNIGLYTLTGELLLERNAMVRGAVQMQLPGIPDGVYVLRISPENSTVITRRLVVKG